MFESSKFDKSSCHIRLGPDLKNGQIPAGAGGGYDIRCNPRNYIFSHGTAMYMNMSFNKEDHILTETCVYLKVCTVQKLLK